jgi:cobalamin biosynthetic protein CobC
MSVIHGGRMDEAIAKYGGAKKKWLDLSTGINSVAYPMPDIDARSWAQLPQNSDIEKLLVAAKSAYGAPDAAKCAVGAGSQAFIQSLPTLYKPQSVAIVGFTYQEHGLCWQQAGHEVLVADGFESAEASARIIVLVNPNNPDGQTQDPAMLAELAKRLGAKGGLLIVDEAFCDLAPELSTMKYAGQAGLLVLRSFGKFFGLAGLRLGFAFGPELLIERLGERLGPWPVSGPAITVGTKALLDKRWINRTRKRLTANRLAFEKVLKQMNFSVVGGTDLFVLLQIENARELYEYLASKQILARPFPGREDWLRLGIPGKKAVLNRIAKILAEFGK